MSHYFDSGFPGDRPRRRDPAGDSSQFRSGFEEPGWPRNNMPFSGYRGTPPQSFSGWGDPLRRNAGAFSGMSENGDTDPFQGRDVINIPVIHEKSENSPDRKSSQERQEEFQQPFEDVSRLRTSPRPYVRKTSAGPSSTAPLHRPVVRGSSAPPSKLAEEEQVQQEQEVPVHAQTEQQIPKAPPVPPKKLTGEEMIQKIMSDTEDYGHRVDQLCKEYRFLDEMLTQGILKLDVIDVDGKPELRTMRREAIRKIQNLLDTLENKGKSKPVQSGSTAAKEVPVAAQTQESPPQDMETDATEDAKESTSGEDIQKNTTQDAEMKEVCPPAVDSKPGNVSKNEQDQQKASKEEKASDAKGAKPSPKDEKSKKKWMPFMYPVLNTALFCLWIRSLFTACYGVSYMI